MIELYILAGSCIFFPVLYSCVLVILEPWTARGQLRRPDVFAIGERLVSAVQAVIASCVGAIIVYSCQDVLRDRHWLADAYAWFGTPYFYYDVWAMYLTFWHKTARVQHLSTRGSFAAFVRAQPLMMTHHVLFPLIYFPIIVWWRGGLGDFFVGCFYLMELAVPFISLRAVLLQLKREGTVLYLVNGLTMIALFAVCRVFIFPFMYWWYGRTINTSPIGVLFHIPIKCNLGCAALLLFQLYWLVVMVKIAVRTIKKHFLVPSSEKLVKTSNHVETTHITKCS